ncbi:cysteine hydrolase family protein [Paenirhodobacter populi]|uniref:cysteine hydrolase family protein n=1 Tax=Paenirhodobacter populi TaxID=2306993 RepID=UPI001F4F909C|nr:isochorismatase family protein [Sinirhodobacter populi]
MFSGVETDVCVLAGVLDAVDLGFAVTVATDAVASSDPTAHEAVLNHMLPRLAQQVRLTTAAEIVAAA